MLYLAQFADWQERRVIQCSRRQLTAEDIQQRIVPRLNRQDLRCADQQTLGLDKCCTANIGAHADILEYSRSSDERRDILERSVEIELTRVYIGRGASEGSRSGLEHAPVRGFVLLYHACLSPAMRRSAAQEGKGTYLS